MDYKGLIGKLGKDIFEGSGKGSQGVALYMGTGAVVGGASGAMLSEDGFMAGAFRGATFGALTGGAINMIPKGIESSFRNSGLNPWEKGLEKRLGEDATRIFKPTYDSVNTEENKQLMKNFIPGAKKAWKESTDDRDFSVKVLQNLANDMDNMSPETTKTLVNIGENVADNLLAFEKTNSSKAFESWFKGNKEIFKNADFSDQLSMGSSFITKAGFDSAYHHIVEPTGAFVHKALKNGFKDITKMETSAAAFSAYGAYEAYHIVDDISNGDYAGAAAGMGMLVGGKLLYSQGVNAIHMNSFLKEKGMTWGGVAKAGGGGFFTKKLVDGVNKWTPEDTNMINTMYANLAAKNNIAII